MHTQDSHPFSPARTFEQRSAEASVRRYKEAGLISITPEQTAQLIQRVLDSNGTKQAHDIIDEMALWTMHTKWDESIVTEVIVRHRHLLPTKGPVTSQLEGFLINKVIKASKGLANPAQARHNVIKALQAL